MNLAHSAPLWLIGIFAALLVAAAVEDFLRLRVSNPVVIGVILSAVVAAALAGVSPALWQNLLAFALILAGGTALFASGKVGGGDVKLFAAVMLWLDLKWAVWAVAAIFMTGGILALFLIARRVLSMRFRPVSRDSSTGVPYAVAIAIGCLLVVAYDRATPTHPHPNPLQIPLGYFHR